MGKPTIQGVFVDFGNVCATFDFGRFLDGFAGHTGKDRTHIEHTLCGGVANGKNYSELFAAFECGEIAPANFFHVLTQSLDCRQTIDYHTFAKLWAGIFIEENTELDKLLFQIPQKKFLLSNINAISYGRYVAESQIVRNHFRLEEQRLLSYRIGAIKPHPQVYYAAFKRAGLHPTHTLFIDDVAENIAALESLGGHGIVYNATKHSISDLTRQLRDYSIVIG